MKRNNYRDYFHAEEQRIANQFLNAGGFEDADDFEYGDGFEDANGVAGKTTKSTSKPYIFTVTNNTTADISNVTLLDANSNFVFTAPTGTSVTYGLANITYQQFLRDIFHKPFEVGLTYIQSSNSTQLLASLSVQQRNNNGIITTVPMNPVRSPFQYQTDIIAFEDVYEVNADTSLIISTLTASASLKIYLYPSEEVVMMNALRGASVMKRSGNPGINRAGAVKLLR